MRWKKLGLVFSPDASAEWSRSHAMLPTPVVLDERTVRVYFTSRDSSGRGRPAFVELDARDPTRIVRGPVGPLVDVGEPGSFDQDGVVACSVVRDDDRWLLYYAGFELGSRVRYRLLTGLAVSQDRGESFHKLRSTPVLERTDDERLFRCASFVWREGPLYRMLYCAGSAWTRVAGKEVPVYDLRYCESADGIGWPSAGLPALELTDPDEHGFGRPWVVRDAGLYRLFFSIRRRSLAAYRLGYAESADARAWTRVDALGLDVSASGWDAEEVTYSAVVDAGGRRLCLYNGNAFGRDGFGVAILEAD